MNTSTTIIPYSNLATRTNALSSGVMSVSKDAKNRIVDALSDNVFHQIFTYLTTRDLACCNYTCPIMHQYVKSYTDNYRRIWSVTLLTIADSVSGLANAIINKSTENHVRIARIVAGMPKAVKQEIANEIFQNAPPSAKKVKALVLLEAQTTQIKSILRRSHLRTCENAIVLSMAYAGRNPNELIAIIEETDPHEHDRLYHEAAIAMAARGADLKELRPIIERINERSSQTFFDVVKMMIARAADQEALLSIMGKMEALIPIVKKIFVEKTPEHHLAFLELAKAMAAKGVGLEALFALTEKIPLKWSGQFFYEIAKATAARDSADQEELLAIIGMIEAVEQCYWIYSLPITGKIKNERNEKAYCEIAKAMAARGAGQNALVPIIEKIEDTKERDATCCEIAKAMATRDTEQVALLSIIEKIENAMERNMTYCRVAKAMAARDAGLEALFSIIEEIKDPCWRNKAFCEVATETARKNPNQKTLLPIIEKIKDAEWREEIFCSVAKELVVRGEELGSLLLIKAWRRDKAYCEIATVMAEIGEEKEALLLIIKRIESASWREKAYCEVAKTMAVSGAGQETLIFIIEKIGSALRRKEVYCKVAKTMAENGAGQNALLPIIDRIEDPEGREEVCCEVAKAMAANGKEQAALLAIIERIKDGRKREKVCCEIAKEMAARDAGPEEILGFLTA
ncbi:MAG: hypothetical protein KGI80_05170 [Verrucomicrobiota bacterium]|nr:hypothetical protein [Verrucomicrobiota bacterium]